jgi:hypothetical protein
MRQLVRDACPVVVGQHAPEMAERRETGVQSNEKPFHASHKIATIQAYTRTVLANFCYLWRTFEEEDQRLYRLTEKQQSLMEHIRRVAVAGNTES